MRTSILRAGAVAGAAALTLGLAATMAQADPPSTPDGNDIVGVGSDTTQFVTDALADGFNATNPASGRLLASWDAVNPVTGETGDPIWFKDVDNDGVQDASEVIPRPNGSSDGISKLSGAENIPAMDFARASRSITSAEASAGLRQFPFAQDTLVVLGNADSPANAATDQLTTADLVAIYTCAADQWNEVLTYANPADGNAQISALLPQDGSGTRAFFLEEVLGIEEPEDCVNDEVQEHDPAPIVADDNVIAPFSLGRFNQLDAATQAQLQTFEGLGEDRVLYHVVRVGVVNNPGIQATFGAGGFICGAAGDAIVEDSGFLTLPSNCGIARTTPLPPF